ncbi:MAG: TIGR04086 family membrane protein [Clostridia bacterium]|nr:TIGR04086 family membrane protein [Clostridia bacterium]
MQRKKTPRTGRSDPAAPAGLLPLVCNALRGTLIALPIGLLLLFAAAAIALGQDDPGRLVLPLGYAVSALTALIAGFLTSRRCRRAVLLCGIFSAACLVLFMVVLSLFPVSDPSPSSPMLSLSLRAALILPALAGAYLGRRRSRR